MKVLVTETTTRSFNCKTTRITLEADGALTVNYSPLGKGELPVEAARLFVGSSPFGTGCSTVGYVLVPGLDIPPVFLGSYSLD